MAQIDDNGAIINQGDLGGIETEPFTDVFVFSHGWWTSADRAATEYGTFVRGCDVCLNALRATLPIPRDDQLLPIGIVWPSMVPAVLGPFRNIFEAFSYTDMRSRAELVAKTAVASLLRRVWAVGQNRPLRIHVLGHSMGCRIACQALETALLADSKPKDPSDPASAPLVRVLPNIRLNVVLFQGAIDNNTMERVQKYGILSAIEGLRVLVTRSDLDGILASYPSDNLVHPAMGAKGPTVATFTDSFSHFFDQMGAASVAQGFKYADVARRRETFIVADLTQLHKTDRQKNPGAWGGIGGNHSDIFCSEVYELTAGFLFPTN